MDDTLERLIKALSPVMNPVQAEGFLHVMAFTRSKPPERLSSEDWPAVESAVREALSGTSSAQLADVICEQLAEIFLRDSSAGTC